MKGMEDNEKELLLQRFAEVNRKLKLAQEQLDIANKKIKCPGLAGFVRPFVPVPEQKVRNVRPVEFEIVEITADVAL